ncbi:SRPBCC domain-containing protein [Microbulbifer sp. TYP-18]|uniref:SRPBCC domain-containing protein n=1 Tax=Microbulbifer sp. TYP-18 TaxID=3230024 RepID=UPI0034C6BDF3
MDKIIHCTIDLPCDAKMAFQLFTDNQHLESWLTVEADVTTEVGGKYELFWDPQGRENNSTIGCKITAIEQNELLAFEWRSPVQFKRFANSADPLTHVVVCFIPDASGTTVHLLHSGWRSTDEWEQARLWQERSWRFAFTRLSENISSMLV